MARKGLGKRLRFEVFKRDRFTCQYCGAKAPGVILHVDHVEPVARGGLDDLHNLVTSCQPCNAGKGDQPLDEAEDNEVESVAGFWADVAFGIPLSEVGRRRLRRLIREFGCSEVCEALEDAVCAYVEMVEGEADRKSIEKAFNNIGQFAYAKRPEVVALMETLYA